MYDLVKNYLNWFCLFQNWKRNIMCYYKMKGLFELSLLFFFSIFILLDEVLKLCTVKLLSKLSLYIYHDKFVSILIQCVAIHTNFF